MFLVTDDDPTVVNKSTGDRDIWVYQGDIDLEFLKIMTLEEARREHLEPKYNLRVAKVDQNGSFTIDSL